MNLIKQIIVVPLLITIIGVSVVYFTHPYVNFGVEYLPSSLPPLAANIPAHPVVDLSKKSQKIIEGQLTGPECLCFDPLHSDIFYTGAADGYIYRVNITTDKATKIVATGGRPLGVKFDVHHNLIVCDAVKGLLSIETKTNKVTILSTSAAGRNINFANYVDIAKDGKIYFTDAMRIAPVYAQTYWDTYTPSLAGSIAGNPSQGRYFLFFFVLIYVLHVV
eukprot:TRINITY_DN3810_c0_g1_i2.p1 TRINITY_DN3810_c0_g1~~TRINITY_DN3810_c0_g1_i2.p1  ORF type:complete len:220 (+),score=56.53 TRINITY_DN3810_c0_g1_i2:32-691(+)